MCMYIYIYNNKRGHWHEASRSTNKNKTLKTSWAVALLTARTDSRSGSKTMRVTVPTSRGSLVSV